MIGGLSVCLCDFNTIAVKYPSEASSIVADILTFITLDQV